MKVAINGFGRIGRTFFKQAFERDDIEIVAINDLGELDTLIYLLQNDSVYRDYHKDVSKKGDSTMVVEGKEIAFTQQKDPAQLPWKDLGVDVVVESTGFFRTFDKAKAHLDAGAKRVVISAPAKGDGDEIVTMTPGLDPDALKTCQISSNASCTTNATTPAAAIMDHAIGVQKAILTTVHGYTATQNLVDGPAKDPRKGRAAAMNIIPTTTGAAIATTKTLPQLEGVFDGIAMRVPVIAGSVVDFTFLAKRRTSVEEVNQAFVEAANHDAWKGIVKAVDGPIVSTDILQEEYGAIIDLQFTRVVDGDLVKVLSWYDNEWGYCSMLVRHVEALKTLL